MERQLLFSREEILARVKELARQISSEYADKEPVMVGVLNGAVFFFSDLVMALTIPSKIDFIRAASYGSEVKSSGSVTLTKDVEVSLKGKHVIVVEDIVDTGLTLKKIVKNLEEKSPESIKVCALIDKMERREEDVIIDYRGFHVHEGFLIGYGLDFDEQYRYLPDIYALR
ncbi:MAG: hypoxanthine phosphoribosyltransferase [Desulfatiglandales bacterium]